MIRPSRLLRSAAAAMAVAVAATACGSSGAPPSAPVLTVITGNSALAQIAAEVGGSHAHVLDVVAGGADPRTAALAAPAAAQLRRGALAVLVGGGYQPALERAAAGAAHVVTLVQGQGGAADGPWLDPAVMARFAPRLAAAMSGANPAAQATYANGERDVVAEMSSLSADFQNSLSDCPRKVIVTPDTEWSAMSRRYGLVDRAVGASADPTAAEVAAAAGAIRAARTTTVFTEPWVVDATVRAAARRAGVAAKPLDTLDGVPAGGWPKGASYSRLMENDLTALTAALQCAQMGQS